MPAPIPLRPAAEEDCRLLWEWRNEPATREASFNTGTIPYDRHGEWFPRKLKVPDTRIFIVRDADGRGVGYVRFHIEGEEAEISVSLDPAERGKGYGTAAVRLGTETMLASGPGRRVVGFIKPGTEASVRSFEKAGFARKGMKRVEGTDVIEMAVER